MIDPLGARSIRPITKVSIPPARGPKSFVMQSIFPNVFSDIYYGS